MNRGQLYTLEGVVAGLVVLLAVLFVFQATSVTPQTVGATNQEDVAQKQVLAESTLQTVSDEQLEESVLFWNGSASPSSFHCTPNVTSFYPGRLDTGSCGNLSVSGSPPPVPPTEFGAILEAQFGTKYSYNVYLAYHTDAGLERQRLVYQGEPGSGSVTVDRSLAIFDDDELRNADGTHSGHTVNQSQFYAHDRHGNDLYNVIHVEVVVW